MQLTSANMIGALTNAAAYVKPFGRWPYFIGKLKQLSAEFLR